jgi:hypothetical protein
MPHDSSRRDFLKKAAYVPPILLSFHAAPSFARPGSVPADPPQPGVQTLKWDVQAMNPTTASSTGPASGPRSTGPGAGGGSSSGLDLPEFGNAASTGGTGTCEPVDERRFGLTGSASSISRESLNRTSRETVGSCSDEAASRSGGKSIRGLVSKLWKSGA